MRKNINIPKKNYVLCTLIFIVTIALSITIYVIYSNQKMYESKVPVLRGKVNELTPDVLDEYLVENDDVFLYVGVADDLNSRELEEDMIEIVDDYNIVYLNISDVKNKNSFYKNFNEKYSDDKKLFNYPAVVYIYNNKVFDLIQKENIMLDVREVTYFLSNYSSVKDND